MSFWERLGRDQLGAAWMRVLFGCQLQRWKDVANTNKETQKRPKGNE